MRAILENLDQVIENIKTDFDYCIAITGRKRRGKSTLGYHISEYISQGLNSKVWLCYDYPQLRDAMFKAKKYDVVFADETIGFLASAKWNQPEALEFLELFDRMGYKNLTIILIMPSFKSFIKGFREDRLDCKIWLKKRGIASIYSVQDTPDGSFFSKTPTLIDDFPKLPGDKEREYRTIKESSMENRVKELKESDFDTESRTQRVNNYLRTQRKFKQKERAEAFGVSLITIKRWDKKASRVKGITPH